MQNEFPFPLQQALRQHHPDCRLKIWWRQAISHTPPSMEQELHPVTSEVLQGYGSAPNIFQLRGIHTLAVCVNSKYDRESNQIDTDEMFPFLMTLPNLRHLILEPDLFSIDAASCFQAKEGWRKFAAVQLPSPAAVLESLSVNLFHEDIVLSLASSVELSRLRSLDIMEYANPSKLAKIAASFPNLERLFIPPNPGGRTNPITGARREANHFIDDCDGIAAICRFPPLKYLWLRALRSSGGLLQILQRHGSSLRGLILEPTRQTRTSNDGGYKYPELSAADINRLSELCPNLEELRIQVKRSQGSQKETRLYKALGNIDNLRSLVLDLHYEPRSRPLRIAREGDRDTVRKALINAATDENLALSIWDLIGSSQSTQQLRNLRVVPFGYHFFRVEEPYVLMYFSRSFLIRRYTGRGSPEIEEIGKEAREAWFEENLPVEEGEESHLPDWLEKLLYEL
ncbi:hypothetical protein BJY04DRAFT_96798 [Aspergillus karnatakaensis]|uniref:uncharacterized protein n=1 Tax=Aspergillus karnatakaensis TaxID=1810916 RepID=UPI003CCCA879